MVNEYKDMSLRRLITEALSQASGDDYDGCFTERGRLEYQLCLTELKNRLDRMGIHYDPHEEDYDCYFW